MSINIESLTLAELREIARLGQVLAGQVLSSCGDCFPFKTGDIVLIRTVTHYYVGRIKAWDAQGIVLSEAAWVADTGRFGTALVSGIVSECEPYPDDATPYVARGAIVDAVQFKATLRVVK